MTCLNIYFGPHKFNTFTPKFTGFISKHHSILNRKCKRVGMEKQRTTMKRRAMADDTEMIDTLIMFRSSNKRLQQELIAAKARASEANDRVRELTLNVKRTEVTLRQERAMNRSQEQAAEEEKCWVWEMCYL
jgi:hypothetical protein